MPKTSQSSDALILLQKKIDKFARVRDWEKFHTPKNLAMALAGEAAELMEIFQWLDCDKGISDLSEKKREAGMTEVKLRTQRRCLGNSTNQSN